jgi:hypothetical protein
MPLHPFCPPPRHRWVGFDIPSTLYMKTQAAGSLGLGGVMMWEATLDGVDQQLLKVGGRHMCTISAAAPDLQHALHQEPLKQRQSVHIPEQTCCTLMLQQPEPSKPAKANGAVSLHHSCTAIVYLQAMTATAAPPDTPCGSGYVGNGVCASSSQCCSQYG